MFISYSDPTVTCVVFQAYWAGPLLGSASAALLYDFVLAVNATTDKLRGFLSANYEDSQYDEHGKKRPMDEESMIL